jgi:carbonic anhydrase/acetyltransferase-like protein (isoleucine patch superfamily)
MIMDLGEKEVSLQGNFHFIAENATVIGDVTLGHGVSVWFNSVIRGDMNRITIGEGTNIQDSCVLHTGSEHTLTIGREVTVGHKAMLHGCRVGDRCLIGINSIILNGAVIGDNCIIGANALVPENRVIPEGSIVLGSPGKVVKKVSDTQIDEIAQAARVYMENIHLYRKYGHGEIR